MSSLTDQLAPGARREHVTAARVEQLYTSHASLVRSICRSLLRDRAEAEDAMQQTFLSAQRALLNGSSPRDAAAWLATIARHESLARVRARMRDPLPVETKDEAGGPDAYAAAVNRHEVGELRNALAELPAQQRDAILMREVRGFSYEEVASALSVSPAAVESLLFRARRGLQVRLREALAAFSPGFAFRDLVARVGGRVAAPAAAKAVGVGAAVITGGALIGPRVVGLGSAPSTPGAAARSARGTHQPRGGVTPDRPSRPVASSQAAAATDRPARTRDRSHDRVFTGGIASTSDGRGDTASTVESTDSGSGDSSESGSGETRTTSSGSGDTSTPSDGGGTSSTDGSHSDGGGTKTTSSGSGDTSTTSGGGDSGSKDVSSGSGDVLPPGSGTDG